MLYALRNMQGVLDSARMVTDRSFFIAAYFEVGDINGDGNIDVVSFSEGTPISYSSYNDTGFEEAVNIPEVSTNWEDRWPFQLKLLDFDRDGDDDLLVHYQIIESDDKIVDLFESDGGILSLRETYLGYELDREITCDDLDQDSIIDVVFSSFEDKFIGWTGVPSASTTSTTADNLFRIQVFPNPVRTHLRISDATMPHEVNRIHIYQTTGESYGSYPHSGQDVLNVSHLPSGTYFCQLLQDDRVLGYCRFIKM